ncbi:MAG: prefoldin subunit alpha [Archaeoglobales archaeon]|nr:MAG: prefoldin subunit alpha [Archaeoglobales archaeon]
MGKDEERYLILQQLQNEAEAIQRKIVELEIVDSQLEKTIESLEYFKSLDDGVEALMNLGGGVFAYVDVKNAKKLLVDVGAGVVVEKDVGDAIEFLKKKRNDIKKSVTNLEQVLQQIADRARQIQKELAEKSEKEEK